MIDELTEHAAARAVWNKKRVLRIIYENLFDKILAETVPGSIVEVGGGAGWLKCHEQNIISSDLHISPHVSLVANAELLPFADDSTDNIVMLDVLHHIRHPRRALAEAERILRKGGRLVIMEPGITFGSYIFYKYFHPEPIDMSVDPLAKFPLSTKNPYDSNQAIATLIVGKARQQLPKVVPNLRIRKSQWMSIFAYPLSGGLRPWSLLPHSLAPIILKLEDRLPSLIGRLFGFRVLIVMERI